MNAASLETQHAAPEAPAPARGSDMRKYRQGKVRIDYYPSPEAGEAIDRLRQRYPSDPMCVIVDALIREGGKCISGKP